MQMYLAVISFRTRIRSNGVRFQRVEFSLPMSHIDKIEVDGPNGYEIQAKVHLNSVSSPQEARELAGDAHLLLLDRMAFNHAVRFENPERTAEEYSPRVEVDAFADVQARFALVNGIDAIALRAELEHPSPPGLQSYALFRSALQSLSPAEKYMHLYHILLMMFNDRQKEVDEFIINQEPSVPITPRPNNPSINETIYTRLRNEMGHQRPGVVLERTKLEMSDRLDRLATLTKAAIELHG